MFAISVFKGDSPFLNLWITTQTISNKGTPMTNKAVAILAPLIIAITPIANPKNVLPPLPKNILAGWKFKIKNPKIEPANIKIKILVPLFGASQNKETINKINHSNTSNTTG